VKKLILEMEIDDLDSAHAGDQIADAVRTLEAIAERFQGGEQVKSQSDVILDSVEDDELIGNWRIDPL
jgi:hypothetical protein